MTTITITIDDNGAIVAQGEEAGELYETPMEAEPELTEGQPDFCPIATQNVAANLEARQNAILVANYGPLDPAQDNAEYWDAAADRWGVSVEEAKAPRCGTCAAFNVTTAIKACIADGLGGVDAWDVVKAGELGYCEAFNFKCSAQRRCDAWIFGGPLNDELALSMEPQEGDEADISGSYDDELEQKAKYGAEERGNLAPGDFVLSTERKFPVMDAADVAAAVSSWGRYKGPITFEQFKERLIRLAKRKGLTDALPQAWLDEMAKALPLDDASAKVMAPGWMAANARRGLAWYKAGKAGDGVTEKTLSEARAMAGGNVSADKAMRMAAWFARHMGDLDAPAATVGADGYPSPGVVAHALWGGGSKTDSKRAAAWARANSTQDEKATTGSEKMENKINVQMVGSAVKALGNGKIGGYLVRFTDEGSPDLTGDYFTADTELGTVAELPVLYHHGQDTLIGKRVLGTGKLKKDKIGLWVEAQLAMRDEYEASIYKLAEDGKLGWSSGAVSHLVEREQKSADVAWIKMWWVAEASLTPTPAEPRNEAATMKSGEVATPEDAVKASAEAATENGGIENNTEDTTMDNPNEIAELKASIAALTAQVNEPKVEAGKMAGVVSDLGGDHDGHKAFTHWLRTGQKNYYSRTETADYSSTKTGMTEGTGTAGGVLVPEGLYNQIVAKRDELAIARRAGAMIIQTALDSVQVPTENNKAGFVLRAEAAAYTESLPTFTSRLVSIYNFSNMIKASNELLADQQASLDAFLVNVLGRGLAQVENTYVVTGSGSSQPLGIQAGGTAGYTFAGAAALTIADVLGLFFALPEPYTVGSPGPVWVMKNATLALIRALTTTNFAFNQVEQAGSSQSGAMLYGYPVIVSAAMPAATTGLKSVSLVNFASSTVLAERSGLVISRNPYLYEEYGQTALFSSARFGFSVTTAEGAIYGTQA
jgi:HK97 family phage major capsid protein